MASAPHIYIDLDGTLLGHNASMIHNASGEYSTVGIDALHRAENVGADLIVATGRDRYRTSEFVRSAGIKKYIAELGSVLYTTGEEVISYGDAAQKFISEGGLSPADFLNTVMDAAHVLISQYPGQIEVHAPYNRDRITSVLLRGNVPSAEATAYIQENGWPFLELTANGHGMFRRTMPGVENVLIYHLSPIGISKAAGIQADQKLRSLDKEDCYMIGDGLADAHCFDAVNTVYIPSNGVESDPDMKEVIAAHDNVIALKESHNNGFAEAIDIILAKY